MPLTKVTHDQIKQALIASGGLLSVAAASLNVTPACISLRVKKSEELQQVIAEEREAMIDIAESALRVSLHEQQAWAVCFTLKTIGKHRGYVERTEYDHNPDGRPIAFTIGIGGSVVGEDEDEVKALPSG